MAMPIKTAPREAIFVTEDRVNLCVLSKDMAKTSFIAFGPGINPFIVLIF